MWVGIFEKWSTRSTPNCRWTNALITSTKFCDLPSIVSAYHLYLCIKRFLQWPLSTGARGQMSTRDFWGDPCDHISHGALIGLQSNQGQGSGQSQSTNSEQVIRQAWYIDNYLQQEAKMGKTLSCWLKLLSSSGTIHLPPLRHIMGIWTFNLRQLRGGAQKNPLTSG